MLVTSIQTDVIGGKAISTGCDEIIDPARPYWFRIGWGSIETFPQRDDRDRALDAALAVGEQPTPPAVPLLPSGQPEIAGLLPAPRFVESGFVTATSGRWASYGPGHIQKIADGMAHVWFAGAYRVSWVPLDRLQHATRQQARLVCALLVRRMARSVRGVRFYREPLIMPAPPARMIDQIRAACRRRECVRFARGGWFGPEGSGLVLRFEGAGSLTVGAVWNDPTFGTKWMLQRAITGRINDLAARAGLAA